MSFVFISAIKNEKEITTLEQFYKKNICSLPPLKKGGKKGGLHSIFQCNYIGCLRSEAKHFSNSFIL